MAEVFAVNHENLTDTHRVDDMKPADAALMEPVACVLKSLRRLGSPDDRWAIVGLGVMGLVHALLVPGAVGYDLNPARVEHAKELGIDARHPDQSEPAEVVVVCPGTPAALEFGIKLAASNAKIGLFAPMPPGDRTEMPLHDLYFKDISLISSYSAGPEDTVAALVALRSGKVKAQQIVSHFIPLIDLPKAYADMKSGRILKAMVVFD
jgi:L-iditol 2-dehydrogenase